MELEVLGEQLPEDIYVRPDEGYDVNVSSCVSWLQFLLERERQTATTKHTNETLTPGTKIERGSWSSSLLPSPAGRRVEMRA